MAEIDLAQLQTMSNLADTAQLIIIIVQVIAGLTMVITIILSIWQLQLSRKEVIKQNQKIIEWLEKIHEKLN